MTRSTHGLQGDIQKQRSAQHFQRTHLQKAQQDIEELTSLYAKKKETLLALQQ